MEGSRLTLRDFLDLSEKLRRRSLIYFCFFRQSDDTDRLQYAEHAKRIDVSRILRNIEGNLNMRLRSEIIDFIRLNKTYNTDQRRRIGKIAVVKRNQIFFNQMIYAGSIG